MYVDAEQCEEKEQGSGLSRVESSRGEVREAKEAGSSGGTGAEEDETQRNATHPRSECVDWSDRTASASSN